MPTPKRFAAYPLVFANLFLQAHTNDEGLHLVCDTLTNAKRLRSHLYAFRSAALEDLPENQGYLLLILPEARTRIEGSTLIIYYDQTARTIAHATASNNSSNPSDLPVAD